jgi:serine/threonine-protein kinase
MVATNAPSDLPGEAPLPAGIHSPAAPSAAGSPTTRPELGPSPGDATDPRPTCGKYELVAQIACGGMGVVYRAHDPDLNRIVALKMIRGGGAALPEDVQRFNREAQAVTQLGHRNIIQVYDYGSIDGLPYFTMMLAEGGSLAQHLSRFTAAPRAAVALLEKVARAMHHAHGRGILHRDLKPGNVLLDADGEPLVSDFGLAKFLDDGGDLTHSGMTPGTPAYMAPEQAAGRREDLGPRTDVWALGVLLYELLVGGRPFTGANREQVLYHILTTPVPPPRSVRPDLDPFLEAVLLRCLEKEPARRYGTAGDLADDLARWLQGRPAGQPPPAPEAGPIEGGRRRFPLLLAAVAVLAAFRGFGTPAPAPPDPELRVTLIGPTGPPLQPFRWVLGAADSSAAVAEDGTFRARSANSGILEFYPVPPWPSYRLEAEVRQEDGKGTAGVYFASGRHDTRWGPGWGLTDLVVIGTAPTVAFLEVRWYPEGPGQGLHQSALAESACPPFPQDLPAERRWHALSAEVTPTGILVSADGKQLASVAPSAWRQAGEGLLRRAGAVSERWAPEGGLGLSVCKGAVSFRNVVVKPR